MATSVSHKHAIAMLAAIALTLGNLVPAMAHAHLVSATPAVGAMAMPAPTELKLAFSEGIDLNGSSVKVSTPDKSAVKTGALKLDPNDNKIVIIPLDAALPDGNYTVEWHVQSTDGHKTSGTYSFESMQ